MKPCRPPISSISSAPGRSIRWYVLPSMISAPRSSRSSERQGPHRRPGADRHEHRGLEGAPRRVHPTGAGQSVDRVDLHLDHAAQPRIVPASVAGQEHGVAEGQEPVAPVEGLLVEPAPARRAVGLGADEGVDHDQQRRAGLVEVGHQPVDHLELEAGADEQVGATLELAGGRRALQGAHRGGADGHHPPTGRLGGGAGVEGAVRHPVPLGVHVVVLDPLGGDGPEGAQPDQQLDLDHLDPPGGELRQQRPRQVESGGGGGHRLGPRRYRVDRLVPLGIDQRGVDVRGQRDLTGGLDAVDQIDPVVGRQGHRADPVAQLLAYLDPEQTRSHRVVQHRPRRQSAARAHQSPPAALARVRSRLDQQDLGRAPGLLDQVEPGVQHAGAIDHHQVARARSDRPDRGRVDARSGRPGRPAGGPRRGARPAPGRCDPPGAGSRSRRCPPAASVEAA